MEASRVRLDVRFHRGVAAIVVAFCGCSEIRLVCHEVADACLGVRGSVEAAEDPANVNPSIHIIGGGDLMWEPVGEGIIRTVADDLQGCAGKAVPIITPTQAGEGIVDQVHISRLLRICAVEILVLEFIGGC